MDMSVKLNLSYPTAQPVSTTADQSVAAPRNGSDSVQAVAGSKDADADAQRLKRAVQEIEKFVQSIKRNLEFSIDEASGRVVVKVIASESGEVVRQIPSEEALKLADSLNTASNVLLDAKA